MEAFIISFQFCFVFHLISTMYSVIILEIINIKFNYQVTMFLNFQLENKRNLLYAFINA